VAGPVAGDRTEERAFGGFIVPYSPEYLRFRSNPLVLRQIAEKTGGQELSRDSTAEDIYETNRQPKRSSRPIFDWFLVALAILVPLDVAVRRVQLDWFVIQRWLGLGRHAGPSTETMGALLERKQAVDLQIEARRAETPFTPSSAGNGSPRDIPSGFPGRDGHRSGSAGACRSAGTGGNDHHRTPAQTQAKTAAE
jgi:hypothetical protein